MNVSFAIDPAWLHHPGELARRLTLAVELSRPPGQASPSERPRIAPDPGDDEPRGQLQSPPSAASRPRVISGRQLFKRIDGRPDGKALLAKARELIGQRGYLDRQKRPKRVVDLDNDQAADIEHELFALPTPMPWNGTGVRP